MGLNVKDIAAVTVALEATGASRGRGVAPEARDVGNIDSDRGFAGVVEHAGSIVDVGLALDLCEDSGKGLLSRRELVLLD